MIYTLATSGHLCLEDFFGAHGGEFTAQVVPLPYATLLRARELPAGTYIFSDLERLSEAELEQAAGIWRQLEARGPAMRLLNHPTQVRQRYELLRELAGRGLNDFDVYRLDEGRWPGRYPVFVRGERDHNAMASGLLRSEPELRQFVGEWRGQGRSVGGMVVTEFCGQPDERGLYRKYAAFKVGDRIIPDLIFFNRQWEVRAHGLVVDERTVAEEWRFIQDNPHEAHLREVFDLAHIDYGRVDYGVVDGRVQVYEINTNPYISATPPGGQLRAGIYEQFTRNFLAALGALKGPAHGAPRSPLPAPQGRPRRGVVLPAVNTLAGTLWATGDEAAYARRLRGALRALKSGRRWLGRGKTSG